MALMSIRMRLRSSLARFRGDRRGISAVEFAILLPVMVSLYLGTVEISQAVSINRKVTLTASTVANLVTQYASISASSQMPDILNASAAVLTPFQVSNAKVVVSCIYVDQNGKATVSWSQALNGTARPVGQSIAIPSSDSGGTGVGHGLDLANSTLVLGEVTYAYTPQLGYVITGTLNLSSQMYMRPRISTNNSSSTCSIALGS
jgi:Flp pilus assembly protein TadG